ncbi:MAG TPA: universal stress protein [Ktedonobacteraceae bacterium]|nr:universal stress protein [Ktedonobacteraceae bacterium]
MFKRILVPLDGSERAEQALPVAACIARSSGGSVILLQVIDIQMVAYAYVTPQPLRASHIEASLNRARSYLTELTTSSMFKGVPTEIHVPFGSVTSQILSVADASQVDSMVLTSHGYTGVTRWVLGSVAEYVVRHGSVPVLLLQEGNASRTDLSPETDRPVHALVPLDGSFLAKAALSPAVFLVSALAAPARGTLHLTQVVKPAKTEEGHKNRVRKAETYLRVMADQVHKELLASSDALDLTITWSVAVHQDAAEGIMSGAACEEHTGRETGSGGCEVIAMATNGRSGLRRWVIGSITERVLTKTRRPLLIVRPSEESRKHRVPTEVHERTFPLMRPAAVYPKHYLMAVIDEGKEAEEAVQSLHHAGIPPEDIRLFESHEVLEYAAHTQRTRSLGSRLADVLQAVTSDEDAHVLIYVEEALRGHALLNVYAPKPEQVERVKDILAAHHARTIKYFGRWAITVLHH